MSPARPSAEERVTRKSLYAEARALHAQGAFGVEVSAALTEAADHHVRTLYAEATGGEPGPALVAVGGYGRGELSPSSDLDLLCITDDPDEAARVVEPVLHGLWDARFKVGLATRSVADTLALAAEDLHTATALLTPRPVAGNPHGIHELRAAVWQQFGNTHRADKLLDQLDEERAARHERYGRSVYLLEPDLKHGPGGLRDLTQILWAAILRFRIAWWADFLPRGVGSPAEARELGRARDFLLKVRNAVHFSAPYASDRLTFELQEEVAQSLGFGGDRAGVEAFMAAWYRHAAAIQKRVPLIMARCRALGRRARPAVIQPVDEGFRLFNGQLTLEDARLFEREPTQVMRMFQVAMEERVPIYGFAMERAIEAATWLAGDAGARWRADPEVARAFVSVLIGSEDPQDALGDLHEAGVLSAMIPEFGAVRHRTHHDLYHVHTVDIHTLHALRRLKALQRGALAQEEPLLTQAMASIDDPVPLYLGVLMHDVGKALGRGHAVKGARLVPAVARRLGLSTHRMRKARWLVRDHLVMAHLSQRRDLSDEQLITRFARQVGDEASLAMLFVLTWADASTTGPQAYTTWKAALLAQLYVRTRDRLRRGLSLFEDPQRRVARLRRAVSDALERHGLLELKDVNGAVDAFFNGLPTPYFLRTRAPDVARHVGMVMRLPREGPVVVEVQARARRGYTAVHVVCHDRPGLLADLTAVFTGAGLSILGADLSVTAEGQAVDIFQVKGAGDGVPEADDARWPAIIEQMRGVLSGEIEPESLVAPRVERGLQGRRPTLPPEVAVRVDLSAVQGCALVEIEGPDRPGLLYGLTRAMAEVGATIDLARIGTEGDIARDTFYLRHGPDGPPDVEQTRRLVGGLLAVLEGRD